MVRILSATKTLVGGLKMRTKPFIAVFLLFVQGAFAEIAPETEGMQDTRNDGTFLTASPTYVFDRNSQMGGIHSESEEWTPLKLRNRILVNRLSGTPSWTPLSPSAWISVGNEIGDLMYQDPLRGGVLSHSENRTPMLEGGFRSKSYSGIWATARYFQIDHYSNNLRKIRRDMVKTDEFSIFGENLPFTSTAYAGLGFDASAFDVSLLAGHEYVWIYGQSNRWIPVEYKPRAEFRLDSRYIHASLAYENAEYTLSAKKSVGNRKEWNGSARLGGDSLSAHKNSWNIALGVAFRVVDDSASVPFGIQDDHVVFPFLEYAIRPAERLQLAGFVGTSGRDFASKDSVDLTLPKVTGITTRLGFKNHFASALNPLGDDFEYFGSDTISLKADGWMQLHRVFLDVQNRSKFFGLGMNFAGWFEKGAETFDVEEYTIQKIGDRKAVYRTGNVERIDSWIRGITGEAHAAFYYKEMFSLLARAGFERIDGEEKRFEVNPVENWLSISASWSLWERFEIQHAWTYRSDARWNLRTEDPFIVKGSWYWDASFVQRFPHVGLSLSATILHAIGKELVQVPNGGDDRTRFFCNVTKTF